MPNIDRTTDLYKNKTEDKFKQYLFLFDNM